MDSRATSAELRRIHTREAIRERLDAGPTHSYLRDWIYGAIDGAVTTFAVVCAVAGAELAGAAAIVIILGVANLIADGFSMAVSNFLGTRAEEQERAAARSEEELEIELFPEGEREEIRQIFARKGFAGDDLERAVEIITSDVERWVETMLTEEHGLAQRVASPWKAASTTWLAFILIGALPLAPYVIGAIGHCQARAMFVWSIVMTAIAFFTVGAFKSRFVHQLWWRAGLETLGVGAIAAVLAYLAGVALKGIASGL